MTTTEYESLINEKMADLQMVLSSTQLNDDEKAGYAAAYSAVDLDCPGWWMLSDRIKFGRDLVAHSEMLH
jgi:hypothetical protein